MSQKEETNPSHSQDPDSGFEEYKKVVTDPFRTHVSMSYLQTTKLNGRFGTEDPFTEVEEIEEPHW